MKNVIACLIFILIIQSGPAQTSTDVYKDLIKVADSLFEEKKFKEAADAYSTAFKSLGWKGSSIDRYQAARAWAQLNKPDSAFFMLNRIIMKNGFDEYEKITEEKDFITLHQDKRWQPLISQVNLNMLPTGWHRSGSKVTSYIMCLDTSAGQDGKKAMTIKSNENDIDGFGTLMQTFLPEKYLGKRIRMTGYMKSQDVKGWAGFWLRVDEKGSRQSLSFDNMEDRPIKGTTEWQAYEIVLDVPRDASKIAFGALLAGTGQIWIEKMSFEEVGKSVHLTGRDRTEPNLNLDK